VPKEMQSVLPESCSECRPYEGRWKLTDAGLRRCDCARGQALRRIADAKLAPIPLRSEPRISELAATGACLVIASLPYFPSEREARVGIIDEIRSLCNTTEEADWLAVRMRQLYNRWPGCREMRIAFCISGKRPVYGIDLGLAVSEFYPDGIPSELPDPEPLLALPAGASVSAATSIEAAVLDLAVLKDLNRVEAASVRDIPLVRITDANRITEADVKKARDALRGE
jgi:hypothetical protein